VLATKSQAPFSLVRHILRGSQARVSYADGGVEGDKGIGQKVMDSTNTKPGEKGYLETAEDTINQGIQYAKETVEGQFLT